MPSPFLLKGGENMSRQDRQGVRTATDIERKYNFGQTFADVYGLISDTQKAVEEANKAVDSLTPDEIFNRLTNYGKEQGIYRGADDHIYINASYIKSGYISGDRIEADSISGDCIKAETTITAPIIEGGIINGVSISGAMFWDETQSRRMEMSPDADTIKYGHFRLYNKTYGSVPYFGIEDLVPTGRIGFRASGSAFLYVDSAATGATAMPKGEWDFSDATVTGIYMTFE